MILARGVVYVTSWKAWLSPKPVRRDLTGCSAQSGWLQPTNKAEPMWCCKCQRDLSECVCPDLKERLERLRGSKFLHTPTIVDKPLLENKLKKEQPKKEQN